MSKTKGENQKQMILKKKKNKETGEEYRQETTEAVK